MVRSWLATLDNLHVSRASSPWPHGHTVQRRSRRNAWNWAVGCFEAKDPSLLEWGRRVWTPRPVGRFDRPGWRRPSLKAELRAGSLHIRKKGACVLGMV